MKKIIFLILSGLILMDFTSSAQQLWTDFDTDSTATFGFREGTLEIFRANPDPDPVNMSATCLKYVRNSGVQYDVLTMQVPDILDAAPYIAGTKKIRMLMYSPAPGIPVTLVLETPASSGAYPAGRNSEYLDTTTTTNAWEWLEFHFNVQPDGGASASTDISTLALLINSNSFTGATYYLDSIMAVEHGSSCDTIPTNTSILDNIEFCHRNLTYDFIEGWMGIGDDATTNMTRVADYTRNPASGSPNYPVLGGRLIIPQDLSTYKAFSIDIRDTTPDASEMLFQLNGTDQHETGFWTDPADQGDWVTYTQWIRSEGPLTDVADNWLALFDAGSDQYDKFWFDNFRLINPCMAGETDSIMEDYECNRHMTYNYVDTLDGWHLHVENPVKDAVNGSDMCGMYLRHGDFPFPSIQGTVTNNPGPNERRAMSISIMDPAPPSTIEYILADGTDTLLNASFQTGMSTDWTNYTINLDESTLGASSNVLSWKLVLDPGSAQFDSIFIDNIKLTSNLDTNGNIGIAEPSLAAGAYPNPFNKTIQFDVRGLSAKPASLQIFNMEGRLIDQKSINTNRFSWDAPVNLSEGMYFYKILQGNHQIQGKLIYKKTLN